MNTKGNNLGRPIKNWKWYRYDEELGRLIRLKRYKTPEITMIKLDPDQALLAACQTGGAYFGRNFQRTKTMCWQAYTAGGLQDCVTLVRGVPGRRLIAAGVEFAQLS